MSIAPRRARPIPKGSQLRWLVRLELLRDPKFGETRHEVTVWAVRPYVALPDATRRIGERIGAYPYRALTAAHNRARAEAAVYYGGTR